MLNPAHAQKSFRNLNAFVSVPHVLESRNSIVNGPLRGLTIAIKDNICTADFPTTCGSQGLLDFTSPYDATVVAKIRCAGGLVAGKTNLDEFGMGSHSTHTAYGHVRNQIQPLSAGGSSGGSAVAVATGQCHAALGTDTGGSVRLPAAYTGIYGFKPSYGLLSRWGVVAYANSLDTVGILSSDLLTIRTIFSTLNAHDPLDPTSLLPSTRLRLSSVLRSQRHELEQPLRIGVPAEYNIISLSPAVRYAWSRALHHIRGLGHTIHPVTLPSTRLALSAYYILAPAEASSNLAKYDGVRYGLSSESSQSESQQPGLFAKTRAEMFHPEIQRRILLGTYTLSAGAIDNYFLQAQRIRRLVQGDYDRVFALSNPLTHPSSTENTSGMVDALITPTAPTLPPSLAALESADPIAAYATDVFTVPVSLAGLPAINLPVEIPRAMAEAEGSDGVEWAGIQIVGQFGDDEGVLRLAEQLSERAQKHEQNSRD